MRPAVNTLAIGIIAGLVLGLATSAAALGFFTNAGDPSLASATLHDLDAEPDGLLFTSHTVDNAITFSTANGDLWLSSGYTTNFGTTGISLQTRYNTPTNDITLSFVTPVRAFGFHVNALDIDWTIEVFDVNGVSIGTTTIADQSPAMSGNARRGYIGASADPGDADIALVRITAFGQDWALLDDFSVSVPEPGTAGLLGAALIALGVRGRRGPPTR